MNQTPDKNETKQKPIFPIPASPCVIISLKRMQNPGSVVPNIGITHNIALSYYLPHLFQPSRRPIADVIYPTYPSVINPDRASCFDS